MASWNGRHGRSSWQDALVHVLENFLGQRDAARPQNPVRLPRDNFVYPPRGGNNLYLEPGVCMERVGYMAGRAMWNVQGSSYCDCFEDEDGDQPYWIELWKEVTGEPVDKCSFRGCKNDATCGGHLQYVSSRQWYLAPICGECNEIWNDNHARPLRAQTVLAKIRCHCPKELARE